MPLSVKYMCIINLVVSVKMVKISSQFVTLNGMTDIYVTFLKQTYQKGLTRNGRSLKFYRGHSICIGPQRKVNVIEHPRGCLF